MKRALFEMLCTQHQLSSFSVHPIASSTFGEGRAFQFRNMQQMLGPYLSPNLVQPALPQRHLRRDHGWGKYAELGHLSHPKIPSPAGPGDTGAKLLTKGGKQTGSDVQQSVRDNRTRHDFLCDVYPATCLSRGTRHFGRKPCQRRSGSIQFFANG